MKPKVSVILTSYNHGKYIAEAIESVLNQTFADFELLIADDGSRDNSREIIKTFSDTRIKSFLHEENRGPRIILQECLDFAQGEYIAIHHSDDIWASDKLEKQVNFLDTHEDYAACFTLVKIIDENGEFYQLSEKNNYSSVFEQENRSREEWLHYLFFSGNCFCHPSVILRNSENLYNDLYGVNGLWQLPDYSAWIRLLLKSNLYVLQERLTYFRLRRDKQENTSADRPDTVVRSEMELYRVLKEFRKITDSAEFVKIFPESKKYFIGERFLPQYALAKILQNSNSAARKFLALDILFDLLNNSESKNFLAEVYNYDEKNFVRENAETGIIYPTMKLRYLKSSLYYDTGAGFNEKNIHQSLVYVRQDGNFLAEFVIDTENEIYSLRFDPTENETVAVKVLSIKINGENFQAVANPPFDEKNDYQIFFTLDPQYIINYIGAGKVSVQIRGIISNDYDVLKILSDKNINLENVNENLHESIKIYEQKITDLEKLRAQSQARLNEIYSSRGYRLLQKYYNLRDKLLPRNSTRRLLLKNVAWAILNPGRAVSLMNSENIGKAWTAWENGGLRELLIRSDDKIHSVVSDIPQNEEYGNSWLENRENFATLQDIVTDIVIPIYNAVEFTEKCIDSVYKNTDANFNLYLIDDCSPDDRIKILLDEVERKEKPELLRELKILRNEENLGFIGSVNRGFKLSKNNVVLLNTDTEVPPKWLSRLLKPMLEDKTVASVTPFSNSAEICSFPTFCKNNDLPKNLSVAELDEIFFRYGDLNPCEIPTGVGFCMLMRRECIEQYGVFDTIFEKGYCEENDWCRRVVEKGFRHVHVRNLFVWHKHGASFAERKDESKQQRLQKNLAILSERYPDYHKIVQEYIKKDPARSNREFLKYCAAAESEKDLSGVMFLNHSMGGGAKIYQDNLIGELQSSWRIYEMRPLADKKTLVVMNYSGDTENKIADFNLQDMTAANFCILLEALKINWIFINQLVTYPFPKIFDWIMQTKIPYTFFGHDFFAVCPNYQLLNFAGKYCNAENNPAICNDCLKQKKFSEFNSMNITDWRRNFQEFLAGAKEVIVPSENTAEIFNKHYSVPVIVREHKIGEYITKTFSSEFAERDILNIAVIGSIGNEKGSQIVYELADKIEENSLPVKLIVIGITNLHNDYYRSPNGKFEITGRYLNKKISDILAKNKIGVVLIPSIWPETYSYTTTEAMYSGYPVMVFDLGAPAERVRKLGGGWILKEINSQCVMKKLEELVNDRKEILRQAAKLKLLS